MDDYKKFLYSRDPERYDKVEAGDLTYQKSIKTKLQCKPFSYFIENVAPDMLDYYPLIDPDPFAKGAVS
jgi:polypeptide N-acetylgalactosaminyltransferase